MARQPGAFDHYRFGLLAGDACDPIDPGGGDVGRDILAHLSAQVVDRLSGRDASVRGVL
jgi:hypothetical protein